MSRFLITGGAGFIGSHLIERLIKEENEIVVLDDFSNGSEKNILENNLISIIKGSVTNIPNKILENSYDGIFHLATHPRSFSLEDPFRDVEVNAKGMLNILEIAKKQNIKVVFTSNSGICGNPDYIPVDENHQNKPTTPYDANKLVSEYYCKIYHNIHQTKSIIFRLATVYGPRQRVNLELGWRPLIATLLTNISSGKKPTINGSGNQTRDLIYVTDVVEGLMKGMNSKIENAEMFLLSTGIETSVNTVYEKICKILNKKIDVNNEPEIPGDLPRMCLSYEKAKMALNFEPKVSLEEGITKFYDWLNHNE